MPGWVHPLKGGRFWKLYSYRATVSLSTSRTLKSVWSHHTLCLLLIEAWTPVDLGAMLLSGHAGRVEPLHFPVGLLRDLS